VHIVVREGLIAASDYRSQDSHLILGAGRVDQRHPVSAE